MRGLNLGALEAINWFGKNLNAGHFQRTPSVQQMDLIIEQVCGGGIQLPGHPSFDGRNVHYVFIQSVVPYGNINL